MSQSSLKSSLHSDYIEVAVWGRGEDGSQSSLKSSLHSDMILALVTLGLTLTSQSSLKSSLHSDSKRNQRNAKKG